MLALIKNPVLRQYVAVIIVNATMANMGLHIVWGSPMLIKFRDPEQKILNRPPTESEEAWIVGINLLAGLASQIFSGSLLSHFGRKNTILITFVPRMIMCFLVLFATEVWMILLGRAIGGFADLMCLSALCTYVSEVAGTKIRGASGSLTQIMSAVGMMVMFSVGPYVSYLAVNLVMLAFVVITYIPIMLVPESPYFLYSKGRTQDAVEALTLLRGNEEEAHKEIKEYAAIPQAQPGVDKKTLLKDKVVIKSFGLTIFLCIGFNANGYNAVNFYLQSIFESAQTSISSEISSLIIGVIQLIAACSTFLTTDRFGRKPVLCISMIIMFIGMIGLGTFFVLFENGNEITGFLNYLPLLSVAFIVYGFNAGFGSLLSIVVPELFEGPLRPYGISCGTVISTVGTFGLSLAFPPLINSMGPAAMYYIFSGFCLFLCFFIYFFVPETKGRSFAEIQVALGRKNVEIVKNYNADENIQKNDAVRVI